MDFAFNEDQELLRATTRRFLTEHHSLAQLRPRLEVDETFDPDGWRRGAELGWTAMLVPAEHGGGSVTDQPLVDLVVLAEELGRVLHPGPFVPTNVVADAVARAGDDEHRKAFLPVIAAGELTAAWCCTGDGTAHIDAVDVTATAVGDGWRLDGAAGYVQGAAAAGLLLVTASAGDRLVHALVEVPADGVTVRRLTGLDLTRRFADVRFDGVTVPRSAVLPSDGNEIVARALAIATVLQAAEAAGAADLLVSTTVQYAKDRVQFGRPIGSFQAIKHRLADLHITLEAMRAAAHYAALALGDGFPDAAEAVAVAGSYVGDAYPFVAGEVVQLHGGIGFTWEHDAHLFVRRARADHVLYGDPAWHRERLCRIVEGTG